MSYVEEWTQQWNVAITDNSSQLQQSRSAMYQKMQFIINHAGWTVVQTCNGTSVSSSNLLATLADFNWAASGARSWFVLASPEGFVAGTSGSYTGSKSQTYIVVDLLNANSYFSTWTYHNSVPTGGTTSAAPTSANVIGSGSVQDFRSTFASNAVLHMLCTAKGAFIIMAGHLGYGQIYSLTAIPPFTNIENNGARDYAYATGIIRRFNESSGGWSSALTSTFHGWSDDGYIATITSFYLSGAGSVIGSSIPEGGDSFTGLAHSSSVTMVNLTSGKSARIGDISDLQVTGHLHTQGKYDSNSVVTYVFFGGVWMPCNTTVIF